MQQGVVNSLAQSYEQARIAEVRDTPVITVVQAAREPVLPDSRRLVLKGLLALIVGSMFGLVGALTIEFFARSRVANPAEYGEFVELRKTSLGDIGRAWRYVARRTRGTAPHAAEKDTREEP